MQSKKEYLDGVCGEIKFKAARKYLRRELGEHIDDKAQEFSEKGVKDAESKAVAAMGDAKETGRALSVLHRPRTEWGVIACMLLLSLAGVAAAFAGPGHTYNEHSQTLWPGLQSALPLYLSLGLSLMIGLYFFDYTRLVRMRHVLFTTAFLFAAGFIITVWVLPFSDGIDPNDSTWSSIVNFWALATYIVSPLFFMLSMTGYMQHSRDKGVKGIVSVAILCAVSIFAVASFSGSIVHSFLLAAVYTAVMVLNTRNSIRRGKWLRFAAVSGTIAVMYGLCLYLILQSGMYSGFSPFSGSQTMFDMLKGAKFIGVSPQFDTGWYPPGTSAYLITAVIVEYGWLAGIGLALAFIALFVFMITRSLKIADPFGRLLSLGITVFFLGRFALFVLACTGLDGNIAVVLPFVSCGSYYYATDALLIGIFLSVWRRSTFMKKDSLHSGVSAGAVSQD